MLLAWNTRAQQAIAVRVLWEPPADVWRDTTMALLSVMYEYTLILL